MIPPSLLNAMVHGAIAVTVNRRLARTLREQYDQQQVNAGKSAWAAPHILSWDTWSSQLFQKLRCMENSPYQLLNSAQSLYLWEQILAESKAAESLLNVTAAASLAQSAWLVSHHWLVSLEHAYLSQDQRIYTRWAGSYRQRCERNHWLDSATLINWLVARIALARSLPETLLILGFDTLPCAHKRLFKVLESRGVCIIVDELPGADNSEAMVMPCADQQRENLVAVNWARAQLAQSGTDKVGLVVPDLAVRRAQLLPVLAQTFDPYSALDPSAPASLHYNISLGRPLNEYPLVGDALRWLGLICWPQSIDQCMQLMLSPYLGLDESDRWQCARVDSLRFTGADNVSLRTLVRALRQSAHFPSGFCSRLHRLIMLCDTLPPRQNYAAWSRSFAALLACLGWPGESNLSSEEFQVHGAWQQTLHELAGFDTVGSLCSLADALSRLNTLVRGQVFQVESHHQARLQVVGLLEAVGMHFDALWVMGMDDQHWPSRPECNPLLPLAAQRSANVPHHSAQWEGGFARRSMQRLLGSARRVVLSYAASEDDTPIAPSPLIAGLPQYDFSETKRPLYFGPAYELQAQAGDLLLIEDSMASAFHHSQVHGGAAVLSDQAECPFRAFALYRLGAQPLNESYIGVSASERGALLHRAMEIFWEAHQCQSTLLSLDSEALKTAIDSAVGQAIEKTYTASRSAFIELERAHLADLIASWLTIEKNRPAFRVEALELPCTLEIAGLSLQLRIDRIDTLEQGGHWLLDYKTGQPRTQDWMKTRPGDVQLPLYALAWQQPVEALALAWVRPQQSALSGVSAEPVNMAGIKGCSEKLTRGALPFKDWSALRQHWQREVTLLAEEFADGVARVMPRVPGQTCQYCSLELLCRVNDENLSLLADDE